MKKRKDLNDVSKKKWDELAGLYESNDIAKDTLYALCQCYSRMMEAEQHMNEKGMLYKNPSGKVEASPMISISNTMQTQIKKHYETLDRYKKQPVRKNDEIEDSEPVISNELGLTDLDDFYG